jgi:hypothetical protein
MMEKPFVQMRNQQQNQKPIRKIRYRQLSFYHANSKGTGAAVQFELRLNRDGEDRYDCFFLEMAHQKTTAMSGDQQKGPATFDWENKVIVKLDFMDICELIAVLDDRRPHAGNGQNGIYHESLGSSTLISFRKNQEGDGYCLGISKKSKGGEQLFKGHILLSDVEAIGLDCVFRPALFLMAFGTATALAGVSYTGSNEGGWEMRNYERLGVAKPQMKEHKNI